MARRTTLKDVAAAAGVSVTAVSLVLNGRPARVSEEKRRLIAKVAAELNYVPNQSARSLVTRRSMLIALIVPDIENLFFASLARSLEYCAKEAGYSLIIANSDDTRATEHELIRRLASRGVDGMFLIAARESYREELALRDDVAKVACPVTLIDRLVSTGWCDGVGFDNRLGGKLAAECLLQAGHTRIGCISGDARTGNANRRRQGFIETLEHAGVPFSQDLAVAGDYRFASGYIAADTLIDRGATAVFCGNDLMAAGFLQRMHERGLSAPQNMSLIGYDNIIERFGMGAAVTTVEQNIDELAENGWDMLLARIREQRAEGRPWLTDASTVMLKPKLIDRGTVSHI